MYNLENNVEWTEELKTAFKKNTTYGSLIFHKEEQEIIKGEEITIEDNIGNNGKIILEGNISQKEVPNEYQSVEYIETNTNYNNQYIDTGITGSNTVEIDITFNTQNNFSATVGQYGAILGSRIGSKKQEYQLNTFSQGTSTNGIFRINNTEINAQLDRDRKINIKIKNSKYYVDNIEKSTLSTQTVFDNNKNIYLFALNNNGTSSQHGTLKIYDCKIWKDGVLVRNYIPCYRKSDMVVGLYDLVNDVFYENQGNGNFNYGNNTNLPNPNNEIPIKVVKGNNLITITNNDNTQSQTYSITLPEGMELCKIGDYADKIIYQNNTWYKEKNIQKIILDGTENWSYASNLFLISSITNYKLTSENICICSHYISQNCVQVAGNVKDKHITFRNASNIRRLYIKDSDYTSAVDFKTWLSTHNIEVYYILSTPILEEITDSTLIEQLNGIDDVQLFEGINHISTITENQKPILNLEYTKLTDIEINESNYLKSIELKEHRYVPDTGFIGQAVAKMATINLTNEATEVFNLENSEFELKIGAKYNDNIYYINYGNFIVDSAPENDDTNGTIKLTAYDYMIKFNKPYQDTITYPCTLRALLLNICNQANIELMTNSFANENFEVENNQFEGKTLREVLQNIAKCAFSWARIRQDNKLYLDFQVSDTVVEEITINDYKQDNFKKANEYFGAINKVTYADNDIEGQEESVIDQGDIILHGIHELVIKNNYFAYTTAKKRELIQAGSVLFGLKYMPIQDLKMVGLIYLESNDIIKVYNVDETYITSIPFCHTINYQGYTSDELTAEGITDNQKEYENKNTSAESNSRAEFSVDRANKKIQSIVSQIGDRTEKTTTITQDIDGIESEVYQGINILDTIEKRGEIKTEEAIDAQVYSIELKGTKEYVAYLHSGDGYSGDSYSNGGII